MKSRINIDGIYIYAVILRFRLLVVRLQYIFCRCPYKIATLPSTKVLYIFVVLPYTALNIEFCAKDLYS